MPRPPAFAPFRHPIELLAAGVRRQVALANAPAAAERPALSPVQTARNAVEFTAAGVPFRSFRFRSTRFADWRWATSTPTAPTLGYRFGAFTFADWRWR